MKNKMFLSSFIVVLLANYCIGSASAAAKEIQEDRNIQIAGKPLIVDPVTDLKRLYVFPAINQKPDAEHIFNQNLEMVATENEPILNGRLPSGKRRLDEDSSAEASIGHSRSSFIQNGHDNQNQEHRNGRSRGKNVGYDDQVMNTNQNYNRRSLVSNNGKKQRLNNNNSNKKKNNNNRNAMAESRKSSSKPHAARQQKAKGDDIFDDDDDSDDGRAKRRSDSDDSIFRDDDDDNESSQDGSSQEYRGRSNLKIAAAGTNPANNLRSNANSMYRRGRNDDQESSSLNDDGSSEDEDIDSTNLARQKVLPAKEGKKKKKQVKTHDRVHEKTERKNKSHYRRSDGDNSGSFQPASNNNNDNNDHSSYMGSVNEQEDATSANSQQVSQNSGDLQTAAGHHHGKSHGHYYQYAGQPKKKAYKWGFKRGNHKHEIEGHGKGYKNKFHGSFKWHAKEKCGKKKKKKCKSMGKMTWEYKHHDKKKKHHHY